MESWDSGADTVCIFRRVHFQRVWDRENYLVSLDTRITGPQRDAVVEFSGKDLAPTSFRFSLDSHRSGGNKIRLTRRRSRSE